MLNDLSTPLSLLSTRRSAKPRDMVAPGPSRAQIDQILTIASRTPDHGKLAPWRFVVVGAEQRDYLSAQLQQAYLADRPDAGRLDLQAADQFARQAPALVVVLSAPSKTSHIPLWEQELTAGAACMNLLAAAHAMGFAGCWLTGWAAYSDRVRALFGPEDTRIAGFMFLGTPSRPIEERPRPALDAVASDWVPPAA